MSIHQSRCADQVSSYHLDSSVGQDHQETLNAVDHSDAVCHSGSLDRTHQSDESEMIPSPPTPVELQTTVADRSEVLSPLVSIAQICSVLGLVVASVAVVLFILRRSRQSKV